MLLILYLLINVLSTQDLPQSTQILSDPLTTESGSNDWESDPEIAATTVAAAAAATAAEIETTESIVAVETTQIISETSSILEETTAAAEIATEAETSMVPPETTNVQETSTPPETSPEPETSSEPETSLEPETTAPDIPTTTPEVPTTTPEVPTTTPEVPTTTPEVPTTIPEVPTTAPESPMTTDGDHDVSPAEGCPEYCVDRVQAWKGDGVCDTDCKYCPQYWEADGEFDGSDCPMDENGEPIDEDDEYYNYDYPMDEVEGCPASCTASKIGNGECDLTMCKNCHGQNGDANFYNATTGVFDAGPDGRGDCCDESCEKSWVGDGECDDDVGLFEEYSCTHCGFFYDKNGVFDADDCCPEKCKSYADLDFNNNVGRPGDNVCNPECSQCKAYYDSKGVFDGGDCQGNGDNKVDGNDNPTNVFNPNTDTENDLPGWDDWTDEDNNDNLFDENGAKTCPESCTEDIGSTWTWVKDGVCDWDMCKFCPEFTDKEGVFDGGDCGDSVVQSMENRYDNDPQNAGPGNADNVTQTASGKFIDDNWWILVILAVSVVVCGACYCVCRRRSTYGFDDNSGFGHSYDKGWNEMTSFSNWA